MRSLRLLSAAFLFGGLLPLAAPVSSACAAEGPRAVLVVDTERPGGQHRFCVSLPDGSVTGIELIQLAGEQHGLQYRFGYGGNVVCQLAGVGYQSDECLNDGPEFWGYWRGDGSGGWDWSSGGGNATTVRDGDVEGWSWGTGNDGSSHTAPPATTFASVCGGSPGGGKPGGGSKDEDKGDDGASQPPGDPSKGSSGKDTDTSAAIPDISDQIDAARKAGSKKGAPSKGKPGTDVGKEKNPEGGGRDGAVASPDPEPTATVASGDPASFTEEGSDGVPIGGVLAAVAAAICVAGAVFLQRRRSKSG